MHKRVDFYRWLGLPHNVSPQQVDGRCQGLLRWLRGEDIPQDLRPWAEEQAALVEELYDAISSQEEGEEGAGVPVVTLTGPRRGWGSRLRGPVGFSLAGILAALLILGGIAWWQGRPGESRGTATPAPEAQVMAEIRQQIAQLEAIVAREPQNADALFQLGEIYVMSQQWEKAIAWFGRLLELQPDNAHAYTDIGIAHMELGRPAQAEAALTKALELDPDYVPAHYALGFLYTSGAAPKLEAARKHWEEVVKRAPGTELADIAQLHLDQMKQESPSR